MSTEILQFQNITVEAGKRCVFSRLFFQISKGEITEIVFSSNSDKNNFIKVLLGDCKVKDGRIFLFEELIDGAAFNSKALSFITQINNVSSLYKTMSIIDNLSFANKRITSSLSKQCKEITKTVEYLQWKIDLNKTISELTLCERVLIELLKAFLNDKQIVILNIPWTEMSPGDVAEIIDAVFKLAKEGMSFAIVENIEKELISIGRSIYFVKMGQTIGYYPKNEVETKYFRRLLLTEEFYEVGEENEVAPCLYHEKEQEIGFRINKQSTFNDLNVSILKGEVKKLFFVNYEELKQFEDGITGKDNCYLKEISINGERYNPYNMYQLISNGIAILDETNPLGMLQENLSVMDNILLVKSNKKLKNCFRKKYYVAIIKELEKYLGEKVANKKVSSLSEEEKIVLRYLIWIIFNPKLLIVINPMVDKDKTEYATILKMINLLKQHNIPLIIIINNLVDINWFEGETIFIKDCEIIDQVDAYMGMLGES